jgi:hypothetical protein
VGIAGTPSEGVPAVLWYRANMPVLEAISISSVGKIIAALWANGSRLLWSVAGASAAAAAVIRVGVYFEMPKAQSVWEEYGLILTLLAVVFAVFAAFKMRAERRNTGLALIPDEQQSFWHHSDQPDGRMTTQFHLRFHATNTNEKRSVFLSKVRLNWPWVSREQILSSGLMTKDPMQNNYSDDYGIPARRRRACMADILTLRTIGGVGRKKPMRISIGVQDNLGRWHKLVFRGLRDPSIQR